MTIQTTTTPTQAFQPMPRDVLLPSLRRAGMVDGGQFQHLEPIDKAPTWRRELSNLAHILEAPPSYIGMNSDLETPGLSEAERRLRRMLKVGELDALDARAMLLTPYSRQAISRTCSPGLDGTVGYLNEVEVVGLYRVLDLKNTILTGDTDTAAALHHMATLVDLLVQSAGKLLLPR